LDRQSPPQQIPDVEGDQPFFGPDGEVFFRAFEGGSLFAYRVRQDGTGLRKLIEQPVAGLNGISPNGEWLMAKTLERSTSAFPVRGGRPLRVLSASASLGASFNYFLWSNTSISISISNPQSLGSGVTYLVPTPSGQAFPKIPAGGFQSLAQLSRLPGARMIDAYSVAPGPSPDVYAFS